jgi:hypothetical protein
MFSNRQTGCSRRSSLAPTVKLSARETSELSPRPRPGGVPAAACTARPAPPAPLASAPVRRLSPELRPSIANLWRDTGLGRVGLGGRSRGWPRATGHELGVNTQSRGAHCSAPTEAPRLQQSPGRCEHRLSRKVSPWPRRCLEQGVAISVWQLAMQDAANLLL